MDLSDNAIKTLGLTRDPFLGYADEQSYFSDALLDATKERTLSDVERAASITLIGGESHSGRSFLLIWLLANLPPETEIYGFKARPGTPYETIDLTLREALTQHGIEDPSRSLIELFNERIQEGRQPVIAIDDAGLLDNETLARLLRLRDKLRARANAVPRFLLVGETSLLSRIDRIIVDSSDVYRTTVAPFTPEQTRAYLRHRLAAAGAGDPDAYISGDLALELHRQSKGRPGDLNQLAQAALAQRLTQHTDSPSTPRAFAAASTTPVFGSARNSSPQTEVTASTGTDSTTARRVENTQQSTSSSGDTHPIDTTSEPNPPADAGGRSTPRSAATTPTNAATRAAAPRVEATSTRPSVEQHDPAARAGTHTADETPEAPPSLRAETPASNRDDEAKAQDTSSDALPWWQNRWFVPAVAAVVVVGVLIPIAGSLLDSTSRDEHTDAKEIELPDFTAMRPMPEPSRAETAPDRGIVPLTGSPIDPLDPPNLRAQADASSSREPADSDSALSSRRPESGIEPDAAQGAASESTPGAVDRASEAPSEPSPTPPPEPASEPSPNPDRSGTPPASRPDRAAEPTPAPASGGSGDSSWLRSQDDARLTIQLVAARDMASAQNFINQHALSGVRRIQIEQDDRSYVAVIAGSFASRNQADQALARLPEAVRNDGPWIRTIGSIKAAAR